MPMMMMMMIMVVVVVVVVIKYSSRQQGSALRYMNLYSIQRKNYI
jgi:hypothetical protein